MPKPRLSELDPESSEYWEIVLKDHELGMNRGRNTSKLLNVGISSDLERAEKMVAANGMCGVGGGRRVKPKGSRPE